MSPSSPKQKRDIYSQSFNWYSFHAMRTLIKLIIVITAESFAPWKTLSPRTGRTRANEVVYSDFVCLFLCYHADNMHDLCATFLRREKDCKWKCFVHHRINFLTSKLSKSKI